MPRQYHKNPRQITTKQMTMLAHDLAELGDLSGIVHDLNTDEIIGGNQRSKIFDLAKLNIVLTEELPEPDEQGTVALGYVLWQGKKYAYRAVRWDAKTAEKANIVANKAGGTWDFDILADNFELDELLDWGFEPFELGLDDSDDTEPAADPGAQIDRAEELRQKWGVEAGQLWRLGEHRLICGDCTDEAVVERVTGGERAKTLFFDPEWNAMPNAIAGFESILAFCDGATLGDVTSRYGNPVWVFVWDCVSCWYTPNRPLRRMKMCCWYGNIEQYEFDGWHYGDAGDPRTVWNSRGEYEFTPDPRGKHLADVFSEPITRLHADSLHNHSKPIDWVSLLIANCTKGDVFDPFLGSGTTLIACEQLARRCRAVEISPAYVAVALQRWADMTGQTPELITD